MKIFKSIYGLMAAAALVMTSCSINDVPEFSDSEAFVAFDNGTASVDENVESGYVELPVTLASISGLNAKVDFEITIPETGGAEEGKHFALDGDSKTLTFTKDAPTQYVKIKILDNEVYGGNVKINLTLTNPQGVKLGANKKCALTIVDNEHPLLFLFNTYTAHITDNWGDSYDVEGSIERDLDDDTKVWINNLLTPWFVSAGYSPKPFYGFVNEDHTEIRVPAGQETGYSATTPIVLVVGDAANPEDATDFYTSGKDLIITIKDGGAALFIENSWGCFNEAGSAYELNLGNVTLTKK